VTWVHGADRLARVDLSAGRDRGGHRFVAGFQVAVVVYGHDASAREDAGESDYAWRRGQDGLAGGGGQVHTTVTRAV
jgi:hypothetical protein